MSKISELVQFAKQDTSNEYRFVSFSNVPNFQAQIINQVTGVSVKGMERILSAPTVRHIFATHGNDKLEKERGQVGVTDADFELMPSILTSPDYYDKSEHNNRRFAQSVLFVKTFGNKKYYLAMGVQKNGAIQELVVKTMYIKLT
ncbi:MAG: hypothetical protein NTZ59_12475 [Bacteroidetes bacterium]|nr:hypothetical protein [Bacteroidota bacterium]